ncbi:MAG: VWA domain-containing protein, partial [Desulfosporosinus sp.]|nr:VWA domain-containing protein [Desulfosporosinus sp.]
EAQGENVFPGYVNLMGDQWSSLYKATPEINPEASGKAAAHRPLIQKMMNTKEYEELRDQTVLDDFSAAIGTISMGETVIKYIEEAQKTNEQLKKTLDQQRQLQQQLQKAEQSINKSDMQGKKPTKKQEEAKQTLENQVNQLQEQISQQLGDGMNAGDILSQASQSAQQAKDSIQDLVSTSQPGSGEAEMQKIPLRQQLELAQHLKQNPKIKRVAEWAGRFKAIARKKQKSKHVFSVERDGIVQGDNPELLLPTELAMLNNSATKLDFYRRFTEKQTLQYSPEGKDSAGKGPIILCLDQSGSMKSQKEQAAGFALAIAMIARRQRRDFAYIPFATNVGETMTFRRGKISVTDMLRIATEFINGGTNFERPLGAALEVIEKQSRFKNADIVFVTDGAAYVSHEFMAHYLQVKKKLEFQCMGCVLGGNAGSQPELEKFTDEWFAADDLMEAAEKSAIFKI